MSDTIQSLEIAEATFQVGLGTQECPFEIHTEEEFHRIGLFPQGHFKLMRDLNLLNPVETLPGFGGVIDGAGKSLIGLRGSGSWIRVNLGKIANLTIIEATFRDHPEYPACALISVNRGEVADLRVNASNHCVKKDPEAMVAGIVGLNERIVERCSFTGEVQALHGSAGGLVGNNSPNGRIIECSINGSTVVGTTHGLHAGGVCAINSGAVILTRASVGVLVMLSTEGSADIGGIAGYVYGDGIITRCTSLAELRVKGSDKLIGSIAGLNSGAIVDVEATSGSKNIQGCAVGVFVGGQTELGTLSGEKLLTRDGDVVAPTEEVRSLVERFKIGVNQGDQRRQQQRPPLALVRNDSGGEGTH